MKNRLLSLLALIIFFQCQTIVSQDYLETATITGTGTTTDNSQTWTDITSVTIDVTNISYVLLTASINMRPDGASDKGREANYNIYRSDLTSDESGIIKRQMVKNTETSVESWGIGTLVHIFNVTALTGDKTYILEHSNQGTSNTGRNVYSSTRLTAVALTTETNNYELSNNVQRLSSGVTTVSDVFATVTGLTSTAISLPLAGDIYVTASINGKANGAGSVAEYKLEYSTDSGSNWFDLGKAVKRSMINTFDDGIVSLVGLLQAQEVGSGYMFRVAHRRVSGSNTITTNNANLVAIALSHTTGHFPSFYSEVPTLGVDITGVSTTPTEVTSSNFTAAADIGGVGPGLYVNAQYLVSATGLNEGTPQRMRARNQLFLDDGINPVMEADAYFRYISDNSNFGSGGFIGLAEDLTELSSCTVSMRHGVEYVSAPDGTEDETLTTSEVILTGFQTYDTAGSPLSVDKLAIAQGIHIFGKQGYVEIKIDTALDVSVKVYTILGKLIASKKIQHKFETVIPIANYKGVAIVTIKTTEGKVSSKKVIVN